MATNYYEMEKLTQIIHSEKIASAKKKMLSKASRTRRESARIVRETYATTPSHVGAK